VELRASIEAALRKLPIKDREDWRLAPAVDGLTTLLVHAPTASRELPAFRKVGRERAEREIDSLITAAEAGNVEAAQRTLDNLHGPAIDILSAPHVLLSRRKRGGAAEKGSSAAGRVFGVRMKRSTAAARFSGVIRQPLSADMLPDLAKAARRAISRHTAMRKLHAIPPEQRRQQSAEGLFVMAVADTLAGTYRRLTGKRATIYVRSESHCRAGEAYGPFLDLVRTIFEIAGIRRSAEAAARAACKSVRQPLMG
jgi:hypothetical protein